MDAVSAPEPHQCQNANGRAAEQTTVINGALVGLGGLYVATSSLLLVAIAAALVTVTLACYAFSRRR
jgi:hypothetical protein